ncbi:sugar efflux transporter [Pantoea sp. DY-15]|uniref:sugar efflux transporter n=1 Tax=Pantoea sp. DY-15 TaxID=2871489 RepID=UPI001C98C6ED|nr:sugar efflux transporter [Pantoea sp. DY-15]MBY4889182.1 sugar efflux transporter [Pantoea sp. DY-15]
MKHSTFSFYMVALGAGLSGALFIPTLSLFLAVELNVAAWKIGAFYSVNALSSIAMSLLIARYSDRVTQRRPLLLLCLFAQALNALLFIFCRDYLLLISLGSLLNACGSAAIPQLFALARQTRSDNAFSAILRAQFSLAWVFGPPLAFWIVQLAGFTWLYAVMFVLLLSVTLLAVTLPPGERLASATPAKQPDRQPLGQNLCFLMFATLLVWSCSALYLIAFPLHLAEQPTLSADWSGVLFGLAAALEIPIMLLSASMLKRWGKKTQMQAAMLCGMMFYVGIYFSKSFIPLMLLQIFNAIFIAIIATVGMFWFQDLLQHRQGMAATLYTNSMSIGVLLAGVLQGIITTVSPLAIWPAACVLLVMSLLLITKVDNV